MSNFTIINYVDSRNAGSIIEKLPAGSKTIVVARSSNQFISSYESYPNVEVVKFEDHSYNHAQARNFAISKSKEILKTGKLHVIEDNIKINDVSKFIPDIEKFMDVFKLGSWFNTTCDPVNYVYGKFNPRVTVLVDYEQYKGIGIDNVSYCSNANFAWAVFNLDTARDYELYSDEMYNIPMFMIIETLAARRNSKQPNEMHYMNYYPTIPSEHNAFIKDPERTVETDNSTIAEENAHFAAKNIDRNPDTSVDVLMNDMHLHLEAAMK